MVRDIAAELATEHVLAQHDDKFAQLQEDRDGILALALHSYESVGQVPDQLRCQFIATEHEVAVRGFRLRELYGKAQDDWKYFDLLVEEDDLRQAVERDSRNGELFDKWQEMRQTLRDYEDTNVYR